MTQVEVTGQVGPQVVGDGSSAALRQGRSAEAVVTELHGRFYEQNFRGTLFSAGMSITSISNATFTVGGIGATTTPVVGVWNPATSTVNLVLLQASLTVSQTALQATGPGGFVWCMSTANAAISTGAAPLNRKTLALSGSFGKDMSGVAVTGITNALVPRFGSSLGGGSAVGAAFLATQAGAQTVQAAGNVENIDGAIIVPPGGIVALLTTLTAVGHSAASALLWEEVPV
jgi:hypothetical protein